VSASKPAEENEGKKIVSYKRMAMIT